MVYKISINRGDRQVSFLKDGSGRILEFSDLQEAKEVREQNADKFAQKGFSLRVVEEK